MSVPRHAGIAVRARTLVIVRTRLGAALWIASAIVFVVAEARAAAAMPTGYDYARDYVSDLGRPDSSPLAWLVNAAFLIQAVAFPSGAVLTQPVPDRKALPFLTFAVINGIGNVIVAVVHSGSGAIAHAVGAVLAIVGGNAAVIASRTCGGWRVASSAIGMAGLSAFVAFALAVPPVGAWERTSVYAIYLWQVITGAMLLSRPRA